MSFRFTNRIQNTPKSFIREILKVTQNPSITSFAGGLPNPHLFPIEALQDAAQATATNLAAAQAALDAQDDGLMTLLGANGVELDGVLPPHAILASNTSSISITTLAACTKRAASSSPPARAPWCPMNGWRSATAS